MSKAWAYLQAQWQLLPQWLQLVVIGGLLGSSFLHAYLAPLLFFSLPLFWWHVLQAPSLPVALWRAWVVWCIKSAFAVAWFLDAYPLDAITAPLPAAVQWLAIVVYVVSAAVWLSSGGVLLGLGVWLVRRFALPVVVQLPVLAIWLVVSEVVGAWVFSLAATAPGIPLNSAFAFGMVGLPSVVLPGVIGWSELAGLYGLSALVGLYTLGIAYWQPVRGWYWVSGGALFLLGGGFLVGQLGATHSTDPATIAVVETDVSAALLATPTGRTQQVAALREAFTAALTHTPEYVLFPEGAGFMAGLYPGLDAVTAYNYFRFEYQDPTVIILDSVRLEVPGGAVLRGSTYDGINKEVSQYDKQYLVPQGEYIPALYGAALQALGFTELLSSMRQRQAYLPGPLTEPTRPHRQLPPVLFCLASHDPRGVQQLSVTEETPFVAHPIAHTWFHTPTSLWYQLDQFLRIQAVWNQVPIVSAGNMAPSSVYLPDGQVRQGAVVAAGELWRVRIVTLP